MSAKRDGKYLLVVTVLTGRKFPQRPTESLRIDVRFDGQLLSSLPVPLVEEPVFDTDMAFRLSGKQLKDHKVQRTPIKIEVNKVNRRTKKAEKIGYQTLDLRSYAVEVGKPRFAWFPLLGSQALRGKPELHLGVSVDEDTELQSEKLSQGDFTRSARNKDYWLQHQPILVKNADGSSHYQIGASKDSTHLFVLTVTLGYASNLRSFFRDASMLGRSPQFFFHYELLDNHLTTKPFDDFDSNDFAPERVSLRLRSNVDLLKEYFLSQGAIKIRLCQGDGNIIATAEMPYEGLFGKDFSLSQEPQVVEKEISLTPVPDNRFGIPEHLDVGPDETPVIGIACEISVARRLEPLEFSRTLTLETSKSLAEEISKHGTSNRPKSAKSTVNKSSSLSNFPHRSQSIQGLSKATDDEGRSFSSLSYPAGDPVDSKQNGYPERDWNGLKKRRDSSTSEDEDPRDRKGRKPAYVDAVAKRPRSPVHSSATQVSPPPPPLPAPRKVDEEVDTRPDVRVTSAQTLSALDRMEISPPSTSDITRRYVCTIFLYKLRIVSPNCRYTIPVYLRYQYPFFGSAMPIVTRPPIEIAAQKETILDNNALTQFTFGCSESQLLRAFRTAPVCIEVWRSGIGNMQDELIGQAKLRLDFLYRSESTTLYENEKPYLRRLYDSTLEVVDLQSDKYPVLAELTICVTLDDYGAVQRQVVDSTRPVVEPYGEPKRDAASRNATTLPVLSNKTSVDQMEKTAALELEMWKDKEEKKFKSQLKKREDDTLRNLTDEWERRTAQQRTFVNDSIQKYKDLEEDLRKMIFDNTQKETALKDRERRVADVENFLKNEKIRLTKDIEEMQRNVIQEYTKRLELEHSAQTLLKAEIKQLSSQLEDITKKLNEREEELARLKESDRQKPLQQREMQAEIDRLHLDRTDLERRIENVTESKEHYKQQWGKALKEVAKMRDKLETEHERRLKEKERELQLLKSQLTDGDRVRIDTRPYKSGSSKETSRHPSDRSDDSPRRKDRLAIQFGGTKVSTASDVLADGTDDDERDNGASELNGDRHSGSSESDDDTTFSSNPKKRLLEAMDQRNMLLQTGIYRPRDTVIMDIDKKISQLESQIRKTGAK